MGRDRVRNIILDFKRQGISAGKGLSAKNQGKLSVSKDEAKLLG